VVFWEWDHLSSFLLWWFLASHQKTHDYFFSIESHPPSHSSALLARNTKGGTPRDTLITFLFSSSSSSAFSVVIRTRHVERERDPLETNPKKKGEARWAPVQRIFKNDKDGSDEGQRDDAVGGEVPADEDRGDRRQQGTGAVQVECT
jgi:hypothetical protein